MPASTLDQIFSRLYRLEEGQRRDRALIAESSGVLDEIEHMIDRLLPPPPGKPSPIVTARPRLRLVVDERRAA